MAKFKFKQEYWLGVLVLALAIGVLGFPQAGSIIGNVGLTSRPDLVTINTLTPQYNQNLAFGFSSPPTGISSLPSNIHSCSPPSTQGVIDTSSIAISFDGIQAYKIAPYSVNPNNHADGGPLGTALTQTLFTLSPSPTQTLYGQYIWNTLSGQLNPNPIPITTMNIPQTLSNGTHTVHLVWTTYSQVAYNTIGGDGCNPNVRLQPNAPTVGGYGVIPNGIVYAYADFNITVGNNTAQCVNNMGTSVPAMNGTCVYQPVNGQPCPPGQETNGVSCGYSLTPNAQGPQIIYVQNVSVVNNTVLVPVQIPSTQSLTIQQAGIAIAIFALVVLGGAWWYFRIRKQ